MRKFYQFSSLVDKEFAELIRFLNKIEKLKRHF